LNVGVPLGLPTDPLPLPVGLPDPLPLPVGLPDPLPLPPGPPDPLVLPEPLPDIEPLLPLAPLLAPLLPEPLEDSPTLHVDVGPPQLIEPKLTSSAAPASRPAASPL
jgi:hypothetical protein